MHEQHAFPHDFRSGPSILDWDPSKWVILGLHHLGLVTGLRRAREHDVREATAYMRHKSHHGSNTYDKEQDENGWQGETWGIEKVEEFVTEKKGRCVILLDGFVVDVTGYLGDHVRCFFSQDLPY